MLNSKTMLNSKMRIAGAMILDDTKYDVTVADGSLMVDLNVVIYRNDPVVIVTVFESMPEIMPALLYFMSQFPEYAWRAKWTSQVGVTQFIGRDHD